MSCTCTTKIILKDFCGVPARPYCQHAAVATVSQSTKGAGHS